MKKYSIMPLMIILLAATGCSSAPSTKDKRGVASSEFQCRFEEMVDGEMAEFSFAPDSLKLSIKTPKTGMEVVDLSEDNFIAGGFTYVQDPKRKANDWSVKALEFVSFTGTPSVKLALTRMPAAETKTIVKNCVF